MANLNWCRTCGKEYPVCPHCEQDARLNPWRMICDTEPHFLVWTAVNQYRQGIISKETAKADLTILLMRKYGCRSLQAPPVTGVRRLVR